MVWLYYWIVSCLSLCGVYFWSSWPRITFCSHGIVDPLQFHQLGESYFPHSICPVWKHDRQVQMRYGVFVLHRFIENPLGSWTFAALSQSQHWLHSACQKLTSLSHQNANARVWGVLQIFIQTAVSTFWLKVTLDLEAKAAGCWAAPALERCSIHSTVQNECELPFCVHVRACIHVCLRACVNAWWDREEEEAHLSQHALGTSRGQPTARVLTNEEPSVANRSSFPGPSSANQTCEVEQSGGQNWWEE